MEGGKERGRQKGDAGELEPIQANRRGDVKVVCWTMPILRFPQVNRSLLLGLKFLSD